MIDASNNQNSACQCYSLVLTNEKGERKFGYCRRVLPEEASVCLPLTYCIISQFRAPGFYYKVLQELESRHGLPHWLQNAFLRELYNSKFPVPGQSIKISCLLRVLINKTKNGETHREYGHPIKCTNGESEKDWVLLERNAFEDYDREIEKNINNILNKLYHKKNEFEKIDNYVKELREKSLKVYNEDNKIYNSNSKTSLNVSSADIYKSDRTLDESLDMNSCMLVLNLPDNQMIHDCLLGDLEFRRPYDHRIEDTDLTVLFNTLNINVLLQLFGSLLLERKVVLVSKCLR